MKNNFKKMCLMLMISVLVLFGCGSRKDTTDNAATNDAAAIQEEHIAIQPDHNPAEADTEPAVPIDEEQQDNDAMLLYEGNGFTMEYPALWEIDEKNGEDGSTISFLDETGETVFWIEQGEAWRADLNRGQEAYQEILSEQYQDVEIIDLSRTEVDGFDAQKLVFTFQENGKERAVTRYILITGYAFLETNYLDSLERMTEDNSADAVVGSLRFDKE